MAETKAEQEAQAAERQFTGTTRADERNKVLDQEKFTDVSPIARAAAAAKAKRDAAAKAEAEAAKKPSVNAQVAAKAAAKTRKK